MRNRIQAPETSNAPDLRPTGIPDSTYIRPAESPLTRLSESLGQLRPALQNFGAAYIEKQRAQEGEANKSQALIKSPEEWQERVKSIGAAPLGSLPETSAEAIESKLHGQHAAQQVALDLQGKMARGEIDHTKTDVNQLVAAAMQEKSKEFAGNDYALSGFTKTLEGFPAKLVEQRFKQVTQDDIGLRQDATYQALAVSHRQAMVDGRSPEDAADAVFSALNATSGPNGSLKVDFTTANKYALDLARNLAQDRPDHAMAIIERERKATDGTALPPLRDTAQNRGEIDGIMSTALAARRKQADQAALKAIVSHDTNTLASEDGKLATLSDITIRKADGTTHTITADSRKQEAVREYIQNVSPRLSRERHETPQQTFNRELSNVAFAGVDHPQWKAALDAAPQAASLNELTNPAKRDSFLQAANLYDQLREKNPLYLQGIADTKTRNFFEVYRVAKQLPGKTMEEAADLARRSSIDLSGEQENVLKGHFLTIAQKVSSATPSSGGWFSWLPYSGDTTPTNAGYVQQQVIEFAKLFARLGLGPDKAIAQAQQAMKETSVNVNGWVIPKMGTLPKDFPEAAASYIKTFIGQYGPLNEGVTVNDVGIAHNGAGVYTLVRSNGMALLKDGGIAHFTLKDLAVDAQNKDDKLRGDLLEAGTKRQQVEGARKAARDERHQIMRDEFVDVTQAYTNYRHLLGRAAPAKTSRVPLTDIVPNDIPEAKRRQSAGAPNLNDVPIPAPQQKGANGYRVVRDPKTNRISGFEPY
jgi:hypothetical protein